MQLKANSSVGAILPPASVGIPMPRYYFDVRRNGVTERVPDGLDLANATAARAEAKATAVIEMVKDLVPDEQPNFGIRVRERERQSSFRGQRFRVDGR